MENSVIKFPNQNDFDDFLEEFIELHKEKKVKDLIMTFTVEHIDEDGDMARDIHSYWFGENSSLVCIGLADRMKQLIHYYMDDLQE